MLFAQVEKFRVEDVLLLGAFEELSDFLDIIQPLGKVELILCPCNYLVGLFSKEVVFGPLLKRFWVDIQGLVQTLLLLLSQ